MTQKILKATESTAFLIGQLIFSLAFLSACEIPNWVVGPRSPNECVDRWMFVTGLLSPSGLQAGLQGYNNRRKTIPAPHTDPGTT